MNSSDIYQAELIVPVRLESLPLLQQSAQLLAKQHARFPPERCYSVELAVEEAFVLIQRFAVEDKDGISSKLTVAFEVTTSQFSIHLQSQGMPFDFSLVPEFDPRQAKYLLNSVQDRGELAAFMLKQEVDHYRLHSRGPAGWEIELQWWRSDTHISEYATHPGSQIPTGPAEDRIIDDPVIAIEPLNEKRSVELAQLVYRSYGNSYVYKDIYYPKRIRRNHRNGTLQSWVARTQKDRLVGHIAWIKDEPNAEVVEWGIAVVDPRWRGQGIMKRLLGALVKSPDSQTGRVLFAHAVTAHPYTQKTCLDYGFKPAALLLGYVPATLQFRGINEHLSQRGSSFVSVRMRAPLPEAAIYPPTQYFELLATLDNALDCRWSLKTPTDSNRAAVPDQTKFTTHMNRELNIAQIDIHHIGWNHARIILQELHRLCCEHIDVIFLVLDMDDPLTPEAATQAEEHGFFLAGWVPMQSKLNTLMFQYLNNLEINFSEIYAEGELAILVKAEVQKSCNRALDRAFS
ncbi:MAG: GNAT family N-acetyltransferase [Thermodesulfobacteriota bacterium]